MKITIENEYRTVTADADGVTATDTVDLFAGLMLALAFSNGSICEGMADYIERSEVADG